MSAAPAAAGPGLRRPYVLLACMLAMFMAAIEATIVATAMPTIVADLGGFSLLGWVFAVYLLAQAISIPIYGRLADLFGRKRVFFTGAVLFLVGSTLCGFARTMATLVLFRGLQGLGAGGIVPIATTIIGDVYTPQERAGVQGWLSSVWGVSAIVGPLLGAFIVQTVDWSYVFWLNLPVGIASIGLLAWSLPESRSGVRPTLDVPGALLLSAALILLLLVLLQGGALGLWSVPMLSLSALLFAALVWHERRTQAPLFPMNLWANRIYVTGTLGGLSLGAAMMATTAFLPTYVQGVMGRSAVGAGLVLAVMSFSWPMASALVGRWLMRTTYRRLAGVGGAVLLLGSLILPPLTRYAGLWGAALAVFVLGVGLGICNTIYLVSVQSSVERSQRGIATASVTFMRMLGSSIGTAVLAGVLNIALELSLPGVAEPVQQLMDPSRRAQLAPEAVLQITAAVAQALMAVFWAAGLFGLAALGAARLMPRGTRPGRS